MELWVCDVLFVMSMGFIHFQKDSRENIVNIFLWNIILFFVLSFWKRFSLFANKG